MNIAYWGFALPRRIKAREALYISCATVGAVFIVTSFSNALLVGALLYLIFGVFLRRSDRVTVFEFAAMTFISNLLVLPAVFQRSVSWWFGIWLGLTVVSLFALIFSVRER